MDSWPHAPARIAAAPGAIMVTGATMAQAHLLKSDEHKRLVQATLFETLDRHNVQLQAWAILANHYHFVAVADEPIEVRTIVPQFHRASARRINELDKKQGRRVWFQFWDSLITHHTSYMARLAYVHQNPIRHGLATKAEDYEFCSMPWLLNRGEPAWVDTVLSFKIDSVNVLDDF